MMATVDRDEELLLNNLVSFFSDTTTTPAAAAAATATNASHDDSLQMWHRNEEALLQRRKQLNKGRSHRARTTPLLRSGQPQAGRAPAFTTSTHDLSNGFWEVDLHDAEHGGAVVGRMSFIDQTPSEAGVEVSDALNGSSTAELKHVEVVDSMRGFGGAKHLLVAMTDVLTRLGCEYVLLQHLDRGSGKLIRYYEQLGFTPVAARVQDNHVSREHMLVRLDELVTNL